MKYLSQLFILLIAVTVGSQAYAGNHNSGWKNSNKNYSSKGWKGNKNKSGYKNNKCWKNPNKKSCAQSVPELDAAAAPIAGLLLTGLLAAGYERRRKLKAK